VKRARLKDVLLADAALGQGISDLARAAGFEPRLLALPTPPSEATSDPLLLDRWMEAAAEYFGIEAEPVETTYAKIDETLAQCAPCLIRVATSAETHGVLLVLESSRKDLVVVLPGLVRRVIRISEVADALRTVRGPKADARERSVSAWTEGLPVSAKAKRRAHQALLLEVLGSQAVGGLWLLRPKPGAPLATQLRHSGDLRRVALFVVLTMSQIGLGLLGWSSLFDAALTGRLEMGPLMRWGLLSLSAALVEIIRSFVVGRMNVSVASIFKRRVLAGALRLDPNEIRTKGSGGILALISEAEMLETAGLGALVSMISATISLFSAGLILSRGAGGAYHVVLLLVWAVVIGFAMAFMQKRTRRWIDFRLTMTNHLVERMVGHRTRMVQERAEARHQPEDAELELYLAESRRLDAVARLIQALPSRGWLLMGFVLLLPALWNGNATAGTLLVAIGGLFVAQSAFGDISAAVGSTLNLTVAWERAGVLFKAAATEEPYGLPAASVQEIGAARRQTGATEAAAEADIGTVLEARRVSFRYRSTGEPILRSVNVALTRGDRVLLQGPSGGGKSTLAGLLAGLRDPDSGMILHQGLDRATLGTSTWRRKVASVPQFHENHVLSGSLLFNLLLGRRWPATDPDRELAQEVCESLGLGPLLARMPSGLEQVVGETGWQLSHGERTRVFLARALLQGAEVVLVDESFGALDPYTLRVAIDATWAQAPTLVVIAHP
jgi:ATP-binding cassette subfamily B protein